MFSDCFKHMMLAELKYYARQPSFYIAQTIFFVAAAFLTGFDKLHAANGYDIHINSPWFIASMMALLMQPGLFLIVNFVANTALKDHTCKMEELLYSRPISPFSYQAGRFCGVLMAIMCVFIAIPAGLALGSVFPWLATEQIGKADLSTYLLPFFSIILPSTLLFSALFYAIAVRTRAVMSLYLLVIGVFVLNSVSATLLQSFPMAGALLDPFANQTITEVSRYWTAHEKNSVNLSTTSVIWQNRFLWLLIGAAILVFFARFTHPLNIQVNASGTIAKKITEHLSVSQLLQNRINYRGHQNPWCYQLYRQTWFEVKQVIFARAFIILCSAMFLLMTAILFQPKGMFNTYDLPFTQIMVQIIKGSMLILSSIVITYYTAEVVWNERQVGLNDITDMMPVPNAVVWLAKLLAIWSVVLLLLVVAMLITIVFQLANGFTHLDLPQYMISLFYFSALPWLMLAVLAFVLQVVSPNKYVGMGLFVLFLVIDLAMKNLELGHHLIRFSRSPNMIYSDLNGFGQSLMSHSWYMLYWGAVTGGLAILGFTLWQRGQLDSLIFRLQHLKKRLSNPARLSLGACGLTILLSASVILYNTMILNPYQSQTDYQAQQAQYELRFKAQYSAATPITTELDLNIDFYPKDRRVLVSASFVVMNKSDVPIERFMLSLPFYTPKEFRFELEGGALQQDEPIEESGPLNTQWFVFEQPLAPGASRQGHFSITREHQGFVDKFANNAEFEVLKNGSFFEGGAMLPLLGYQPDLELTDPNTRKKLQLPELKTRPKLVKDKQYHRSDKGPDIGYIRYSATLSTSADQIAIAPGQLEKQWQQDDRRYFYYRSETPIPNSLAFMSGRFKVKSTRHEGINIDIYHHPTHDDNLTSMQQAVADSLAYFSDSFGPYLHKQVKIVEFPGYRNYAQSFPNTIAFSERLGFIMDLNKPDALDQIYYVTAHEMAHQWWGNRVDSAHTQGSAVLVETLAQYSALMLFRRTYGDSQLRKVLQLELDRYLRGRANDPKAEQPLLTVEDQSYIHYHKGSVVMMALVERLGEVQMNRALAQFVATFEYGTSALPTTWDLIAALQRVAHPQDYQFIEDAFTQVTRYDIKAQSMTTHPTANGQFNVTFSLSAEKYLQAPNGNEDMVPMSEPVKIAFYAQVPRSNDALPATPIKWETVDVNSGVNQWQFTLSEAPTYAVIDPLVTLIDKNTIDNNIR